MIYVYTNVTQKPIFCVCVLTKTIKATKLKSKSLFCFGMITTKMHRYKRKIPSSHSEAAIPEDALILTIYFLSQTSSQCSGSNRYWKL